MPRRRIRQLAIRHAALAALLGVVIGAGFSVLQVGADYQESVEAERREIQQLLAVMREPAAQAGYHLNEQAARVVVQGALAYGPVLQASLVSDFGETLARASQPVAVGGVSPWWARFIAPTLEHSLTLQYGPGRQRVGELRVVTAQALRVERFLNTAWRELGLNVLRSVIVALALGVLTFLTLTRPLVSIARRIGSGPADPAGQAPMPEAARHDEIGQIAAAFERYEREAGERALVLQASARALAASEVRHRRIVETAAEGVWQLDLDGRTQLANAALARMLGSTPEALLGRPLQDFADPDDPAAVQAVLDGLPAGAAPRHELRLRRVDGQPVWVEVSHCPVTDEQGRRCGTLAMVTNATERRRRDDELRATNARLSLMVSDLERHKADMAQIAELNGLLQSARTEAEAYEVIRDAAARLFPEGSGGFAVAAGEDQMQVVGTWGDSGLLPTGYLRSGCWAIRRGRVHLPSGEHGVRCGHQCTGDAGALLCQPLYVERELVGVLHLHRPDATDPFEGAVRQRAEVLGEVVKLGLSNLRLRDTLREQALRDPLTGLPNRRLFDETLRRELAACLRAGQPLTLAVVDVDHFKRINDRHGHEAGDRVLRAVAQVLLQGIRASDMAGRYGGDEFMCLLPGIHAADAAARFQQALARLAQAHDATGLPDETITFSVGLASAPDAGQDPASLAAAADAALYTAKARGRNGVAVAGEAAAPLRRVDG
jgi:diguanylate cyclase (GGDEF)-like protein/PAS domain S-box-containing protein